MSWPVSQQQLPECLPDEWVTRWRPVWLAIEEQEAASQQVMGKIAAPAHSQEHHHGKSGEMEIDALAAKGKGLDG